MLRVKYIGQKASQFFRFEDLEVTWFGQGDVQLVPEQFAGTINQHPSIWEIVGHAKDRKPAEITEEKVEEPVEIPALVDINSMDKAALHAYCQREFGLTTDPKWPVTRLRKYVQDVMGQKLYDAK